MYRSLLALASLCVLLNSTAMAASGPLVFSAAPRETPEEGRVLYEPLARFMSSVLGREVVYQHPDNWHLFQLRLSQGEYDIVFEDAHLARYSADKLNHTLLAKVPASDKHVVFITDNNSPVTSLARLVGRPICANAPPDLGTTTVLAEFSNPVRQPLIINTEGWHRIYEAVKAGRCVAGILPGAWLSRYQDKNIKVIHSTTSLPAPVFSAGPRLTKLEKTLLSGSLVSSKASAVLGGLRRAYLIKQPELAAVEKTDYRNLGTQIANAGL